MSDCTCADEGFRHCQVHSSTVPLLWHAQKMTEMIERCSKIIEERDALRLRVEELEELVSSIVD